jgi:hypothetical protein
MSDPAATSIAFVEKYSDGSGVEFAVRYDAHLDSYGEPGRIELEHDGTVTFPADRIDWIIERLIAVRSEIRRDCA